MLGSLLLILTTQATASLAAVHSLNFGDQCLQVTGTPSDGSAVVLGECDGSNPERQATGQQWIIADGNNERVQLFDTDLCLDAQMDPAPGRSMVVSSCAESPSQTWWLTGDRRIAITGGNQCLQAGESNAVTDYCGPGIEQQAWNPVYLFDEGDAGAVAGPSASLSGNSTVSGASATASGTPGTGSSVTSAPSLASSAASAMSVASQASGLITASGGSIIGAGTSGAESIINQATSAFGSAVSAASSAVQSTADGANGGFSRAAFSPLIAVVGLIAGAAMIL